MQEENIRMYIDTSEEGNCTIVRPIILGSNALEIAFGTQFGPRRVSEVPRVRYFLRKFPKLYESVRVLMTEANDSRFKSLEEVILDLNMRWIDPEHYFESSRQIENFSRTGFAHARNIVVQKWFFARRKLPTHKHEHAVKRIIFPVWKDKHHRLSRCYGGTGGRNLSFVPRSHHLAYHVLFDNNGRPELPSDLARRVGLTYAYMKTLFWVDGHIRAYDDQLELFNEIWAPGGHCFKRGSTIKIN